MDYVSRNYPDAAAMDFHLDHDVCESCRRWVDLADALGQISGLLRISIAQAPLFASNKIILAEGVIPGGSNLHQRTTRDEEGNIRIQISSGDMALDGVEVEVVPIEKEHPSLTLRKIDGELVYGEVVIPAALVPSSLERPVFKLRPPTSI